MNFTTKSTLVISLLFSGTIFGMENKVILLSISDADDSDDDSDQLGTKVTESNLAAMIEELTESRSARNLLVNALSMDDANSHKLETQGTVSNSAVMLSRLSDSSSARNLPGDVLSKIEISSSPLSERSRSSTPTDSPRKLPRTTCTHDARIESPSSSSDSIGSSPSHSQQSLDSDGNRKLVPILNLALGNPTFQASSSTSSAPYSPYQSPSSRPAHVRVIALSSPKTVSSPASLKTTPRSAPGSPTGSSNNLIETKPISGFNKNSPTGSADSLVGQGSGEIISDEDMIFTENLSEILCDAIQTAQQENNEIYIATENVDDPKIIRKLSTDTGRRVLIISQQTAMTKTLTELMQNNVLVYRASYPITGTTGIFGNFGLVSPTYVPKQNISSTTDQLRLLPGNQANPHFVKICAAIETGTLLTLPAIQSSSSALQEQKP